MPWCHRNTTNSGGDDILKGNWQVQYETEHKVLTLLRITPLNCGVAGSTMQEGEHFHGRCEGPVSC